jgi:hypothetical protein
VAFDILVDCDGAKGVIARRLTNRLPGPTWRASREAPRHAATRICAGAANNHLGLKSCALEPRVCERVGLEREMALGAKYAPSPGSRRADRAKGGSMTSILSSISSQFSKALLFGAMLPAVTFLAIVLVVMTVAMGGSPLDLLNQVQTGWQVLGLTFATVVMSGLLFNLNVPITQLYEGYVWENSLLGRWRTRCYQEKWDSLDARWRGLRTLVYAEQKAPKDPSEKASTTQTYFNEIARQRRGELPIARQSVLPTRLGNIIRNFENYPRDRYGMSAIPLWPRLLAKVDSGYAAVLDDTKTSFDFALNCSFLSTASALTVLIFGVAHSQVPSSLRTKLLVVGAVLGFVMLSYMFYGMMISRAVAWGEVVKGAFDLYRNALLNQLGYSTPKTLKQERELWEEISQRLLFGDSPRLLPTPYATLPVSVQAEPHEVPVVVTRGVKPAADKANGWIVVLCVENVSKKIAAKNIRVTDTLTEPFRYLWGTAKPSIRGSNPYTFTVDDLSPGAKVEIEYCVVVPVTPDKGP